MDGQDPRPRYPGPSQHNASQDGSYNTAQNTNRNFSASFSDMPGNGLYQQRLDPATTSNRHAAPSTSALPYTYYNDTVSSTSVPPSINNSFSSTYSSAPSRHQSDFSGYALASTYVGQNESGYDASQQYMQSPAAPPQMTETGFYGLGTTTEAGQPSMYDSSRQSASLGLPLVQTPSHLQPSSQILAANAPDTRSRFAIGREKVYQQLRPIYNHIKNENLHTANWLLLELSQWFLATLDQMDLTVDIPDNEEIQEKDYQLWTDFNNAWLALFQKQYKETSLRSEAGELLEQPDLLSVTEIATSVTRLSSLAKEYLEDKGLVDYERGLWEEEITRSECLPFQHTSRGPY